METDHNAAPLNPLPWVVWLLVLPMAGFEVAFSLGAAGLVGGPEAVGWRLNEAAATYGFYPARFRDMLANQLYLPGDLLRFVSYTFIHYSFVHALFAVVMTLALGKAVGEVFRAWAVLVVFFAASAVGALVYGFLGNSGIPLLGAFPAIYGLVGAFTFLIWVNLARVGANKLRAFSLIGFLLFAQLLFGVLFGGSYDWAAVIAGFATGFGVSFIVSPGGWGRALAQIRGR